MRKEALNNVADPKKEPTEEGAGRDLLHPEQAIKERKDLEQLREANRALDQKRIIDVRQEIEDQYDYSVEPPRKIYPVNTKKEPISFWGKARQMINGATKKIKSWFSASGEQPEQKAVNNILSKKVVAEPADDFTEKESRRIKIAAVKEKRISGETKNIIKAFESENWQRVIDLLPSSQEALRRFGDKLDVRSKLYYDLKSNGINPTDEVEIAKYLYRQAWENLDQENNKKKQYLEKEWIQFADAIKGERYKAALEMLPYLQEIIEQKVKDKDRNMIKMLETQKIKADDYTTVGLRLRRELEQRMKHARKKSEKKDDIKIAA
ncbi:MAG: hypothetical protein WC310_00540 [Patescibacteria group bacterium]|jgi:hypothetical protein